MLNQTDWGQISAGVSWGTSELCELGWGSPTGPQPSPSVLLRSVNILHPIYCSLSSALSLAKSIPPPWDFRTPSPACSHHPIPAALDHLHHYNWSSFCQSWFLKSTHHALKRDWSKMQIPPLPKAEVIPFYVIFLLHFKFSYCCSETGDTSYITGAPQTPAGHGGIVV